MKNVQIIPYGTKRKAKVLKVDKNAIFLECDDNQGYVLVGHGMQVLPKEGDTGTITFTRHSGPTKGHWAYTPDKK